MNYSEVRNPKWSNEERTAIDCVVKFGHLKREVPYTSTNCERDSVCREIFQRCANGEFGQVADFDPKLAPPTGRITIAYDDLPASWKGWPEMEYFLKEANFENAIGSVRGIVVVWSSAIEFLLGSLLEMSERKNGKSQKSAKKDVGSRWKTLGSKTTECFKRELITTHDAEICKWVGVARNKITHEWRLDLNDPSFGDTFLKAVKELHNLEHAELFEWNDHDLLFIIRMFYAGSCASLSVRLAEKRFHMSEAI